MLDWWYKNKYGGQCGPYRSAQDAESDILFDVEPEDREYVLARTELWTTEKASSEIFNDKPTPIEQHFVEGSFGVGGICGCDGAIDFGCPLCTESVRIQFIHKLRELVTIYR